MSAGKISWQHAPEQRLCVRGTYFVTASTYPQAQHFAKKSPLAVLHRGLLKVAADFGWQLEAWAVFSKIVAFWRNALVPKEASWTAPANLFNFTLPNYVAKAATAFLDPL